MIFIVEGIDRVGKTILCNKLAEIFKIPILKQERIDGNDKTDYIYESNLINYGTMLGQLNFWKTDICKDLHMILDRFHWTEYVYSKCLRDSVNRHMLKLDEMVAEMPNTMMIFVTPVDVERSSEEHGKDLAPYNKEYWDLYLKHKGQKFACNFESMDEIIQLIINSILNKN